MAFVSLLQILAIFGQSADPFRFNNRGVAYLEQYEFSLAAEEFQKALRVRADFIPARVNLGIAYYYLADYAKATVEFREALKQDPSQPHANFMLGLIIGREKDREAAFRHFQQVLAVDPEDPATHYNLGLLHTRNRDYQRAIASFQKVLQFEPYHVSALYNLAMAQMRAGRQQESRQTMRRFQELKSGDQAGGPTGAMGVQYGEEGRYALGIGQYDPILPASSQLARVRFIDATAQSGIQFVHRGTGKNPLGSRWQRSDFNKEAAEKTLVSGLGSGSAFLDFDNDGKMDWFVVDSSAQGAGNRLYRNIGNGAFEDVTDKAGLALKHAGMGVAVGDFNNDGFPDLFITGYGGNYLFRNEKNGTFKNVTEEARLANSPTRWSLSAAFFDYDHDGDLDLYVTNFVDLSVIPDKPTFVFPDDFSGQENQLLRNNGNGTFTDITAEARVSGGKAKSTGVVFFDFNNSRDIDLLVINHGAPPNLFSNKRDGTFEDVAANLGLTTFNMCGVSSADLNKDSFQDIALPRPTVWALRNSGGRKFIEMKPAADNSAAGAWGSLVFDYDNDGWLDLLLLGERTRLFRNEGARGFTDVSEQSGFGDLPTASVRSAAVADYDGDGDNDVIMIINGAKPLVLRNDGGNQNKSVKINLSGLRDNKSGLGAKIEIRAGQAWQKLEVNGNIGFLSQSSPELVFGLGKKQAADSIRILWPTGVLQAELERPAGQTIRIEEVDRKGTSCPLLYAWNGHKYDFITDFLGGSAVGYLVAPGVYGSVDVDEYVKIANMVPQPKDGLYSIKMNNQLEEVMFIDEVRLLAVDHPDGTSVYPDEKLMPAPPYPSFKLFLAKDSRPPIAATDENGRNVLPALLKIDRNYPDSFKLLPFKGYAEPHELILDLGDVSQAEKVLLLMTAWIDYADSSSNLAASQAGAKLIPPYLQVVDTDGKWVTTIDSIGFPAGLPKTMTVDLSGKFRHPTDFRVKIVTSMRIYWDQILLDTYSSPERPRVTTLKADRASLAFYGYPREVKPDGKNPPMYDYHDRSTTSPWKNHIGSYTRYGDVKQLLEAKDDMYVVMRHGDEITAEFEAAKLPPIPDGWRRSFLVYAAGFGKDMDLNSANPDTVGPLPSHSGTYPDSPAHRDYLKTYNTREIRETFNW